MNLEELVEKYGLSFCEEYYSMFIDWCKDRGYVDQELAEEL